MLFLIITNLALLGAFAIGWAAWMAYQRRGNV